MEKYQAFLSYAHADEVVATRVHKALETFSVPRALRTKTRSTLSPIFRDVTELTAHHSLSEKIRDAVQNSRFLIVLCSPASKDSHWVNEEIRLFRKLHGEGSILCALIEGTPGTSFPPALTEDGREPLAADMTGQKESFRIGISQMAASMLGVGLDDLLQRENSRRRKRMQLITTGALIFAGLMGGMAWTAIDARDEAEVSRSEAERMVEYLLTDLQGKLDELRRLDLLDDVGNRVVEYYDAIPPSDMDDERLARKARALNLLGWMASSQGDLERAEKLHHSTYEITKNLLARHPDNPEIILSHSHSEYSLLRLHLDQKEPGLALPNGVAYRQLSKKLYQINPSKFEHHVGYAWSANKLGQIHQGLGDYQEALSSFSEAHKILVKALPLFKNKEKQIELDIITYERNKAIIQSLLGNHQISVEQLKHISGKIDKLMIEDPENIEYLDSSISTKHWLVNIQMTQLDTCSSSSISDLLNDFEKMISHDPTNLRIKGSSDRFRMKSNELCPDNSVVLEGK